MTKLEARLRLHHNADKHVVDYAIFTNKRYTPTFCCVAYPEYYEIAKYSFYIRVDKSTLHVTTNRINPNCYETDAKYRVEIID